nr:unnamed protein product [Spirometra erinaceieuropaei]
MIKRNRTKQSSSMEFYERELEREQMLRERREKEEGEELLEARRRRLFQKTQMLQGFFGVSAEDAAGDSENQSPQKKTEAAQHQPPLSAAAAPSSAKPPIPASAQFTVPPSHRFLPPPSGSALAQKPLSMIPPASSLMPPPIPPSGRRGIVTPATLITPHTLITPASGMTGAGLTNWATSADFHNVHIPTVTRKRPTSNDVGGAGSSSNQADEVVFGSKARPGAGKNNATGPSLDELLQPYRPELCGPDPPSPEGPNKSRWSMLEYIYLKTVVEPLNGRSLIPEVPTLGDPPTEEPVAAEGASGVEEGGATTVPTPRQGASAALPRGSCGIAPNVFAVVRSACCLFPWPKIADPSARVIFLGRAVVSSFQLVGQRHFTHMTDTEAVNDAGDKANGLPPALDLQLDKNKFTRSSIFFTVGLPIGREYKSCLEKLRSYMTGYLNLPKFKSTYTDKCGLQRKLIFIRQVPTQHNQDEIPGVKEKGQEDCVQNGPSWKELRELGVDIPASPEEELQELVAHPEAAVPPSLGDCIQPDGLPSIPCAFRMTLTYDNLTLEKVLKELLPKDMDAVTGFSVIGHIAHFNLKPEALPYRKLIGEVVLDKLPQVRTVLHKASKIDTDFRTFSVDLMAGEPVYLTTVKENNVSFKLDFSKVYWNSRLGTEHSRIVSEVKRAAGDGDASHRAQTVVYDVFAGIGPFSIPLARHGCTIFANDLNPASFGFLEDNLKANSSRRYPITTMRCFNLDGREFIRQTLLPHYYEHTTALGLEELPTVDATNTSTSNAFFMLMNLPGLAPEFLDALTDGSAGWQDPTEGQCRPRWLSPPIRTRCYCFVRHADLALESAAKGPTAKRADIKLADADREAEARVLRALNAHTVCRDGPARHPHPQPGRPLICDWKVRFVRNVAPYKDMYCVEFSLYLPEVSLPPSDPNDCKRPRIE